ncbi:glutamate mutase L [Thermoanaerobacter mathranii]|uniref:glutamate mutase L n=1 Tax=Thermoanaerobacter mathranii TaxID=583357 RepID=UPI0002FF4C2F|nr:glutamate mutase L [Thermoanaerobacter mathranii]
MKKLLISLTGGIFSELEGGEKLLENIIDGVSGKEFYPPSVAKVLIDRDYIMAACVVF